MDSILEKIESKGLCFGVLITSCMLMTLAGCSGKPTPRSSAERAAENAATIWWKNATPLIPPVKTGTIKEAHKATILGRVYSVPKHVQSRKEETEGHSRTLSRMQPSVGNHCVISVWSGVSTPGLVLRQLGL